MSRKLVVFGGRDFTDATRMMEVLNTLHAKGIIPDDVELVCGMARGADITAYRIFDQTTNIIHKFPADWATHGKAAGPIRNVEMARFADIGLGFWDGKSKGTKHMIDTMDRFHRECYIVRY